MRDLVLPTCKPVTYALYLQFQIINSIFFCKKKTILLMFYWKHVTHSLCLIILQKVTDSALDGTSVIQPLIWRTCDFGKLKLSLHLQPGIGLSSCVSKVKLEQIHVRVASQKGRDYEGLNLNMGFLAMVAFISNLSYFRFTILPNAKWLYL